MNKTMRWLAALAVMMVMVLMPLPVQAADGDGDGSGGGQNNPLVIESSTPADGAAGVSNLEYIKLVFSKNVVYMTVRDKNMQGFSLWSGSERIPADIIMADDQVEREKRNDVLVKPRQPLKAGATYRVEVAPEVQSKSGVTMGKKATITFTMAGGTKAPATVTPEKEPPTTPGTITGNQTDAGSAQPAAATNTDPAPGGTAAGSPTDTAATTSAAADPQPEANSPAGSNSNTWLWIALGAAVLATVAVVLSRMRAKN